MEYRMSSAIQPSSASAREPHRIFRHAAVTRITHWLNALFLLILLMSGLQIFNAHPALYWGMASTFTAPALALTAKPAADGQLRGETQVGRIRFASTGVLGADVRFSSIL